MSNQGLDYSLQPFLGGNMPTDDTNAEARIGRQLETISGKLDTLLQSYGKLNNEVEHLAEAAKSAQEYGTRLTVVETKAETNEKWIQRSGENNRWLIGLCIITLLGVIGLAMKVFGHG